MKKIWFFIAAIAIISCKQETPVDYAVLTGKITNIELEELTISSMDRAINKKIKIAEDGSFIDTLRVKTGIYILLDGKNMVEIYLNKGNAIAVNYDANDFENTLTFLGEGSQISSYLFAKRNKSRELVGKGTTVYTLEEDAYKAKFREIKTALEDILLSSEGISEEFKTKEKRNLNYAYLGKLNIYQIYHAHYANKPEFKVSEGFLKELEGLTYANEEDFLFSPAYKNLVVSYYREKSTELAKKDSIDISIANLKIAGLIANKTIKNSLLFDNAKFGITYAEDLEIFYTTFMESSSNEEHKKEITKSYTKLKAVAKGQPSPKFIDYENYNGSTTSLNDLKGKYVYVDVWATWCGPCIKEIPFLKEVEKKYHGKNIEFVSISIDTEKDYSKWREMVKEKGLIGIQLFADKDWESDFVTEYLIKGIPRFILIDPNGNIVNANAPRPSNSKLIDLFNKLNI